MDKRRESLSFVKYVLSHFIVILIVIIILGGYLYSFFYNTIYSEFQLANEQYVSSFESRHENDLQIVDDIVTQMGLADDATRFYLEKQPDKAMKLKSYLNRYVLVSQFFSMILYQYHDDHFIYSQLSSIEIDDFFERDCILEETSSEMFRKEILKKILEIKIVENYQSY